MPCTVFSTELLEHEARETFVRGPHRPCMRAVSADMSDMSCMAGVSGWVGLKTLVAGLTRSKGSSESEIPSHVDDSRCFSIVFKNKTAIHLELPVLGNGRSRAEWLDAFRDLCDGSYKALLHPGEFEDT